jgi:hypothetical protein
MILKMHKPSYKIIQLMIYESRLKELKKEIIFRNRSISGEIRNSILEDMIKGKIAEYEMISLKYIELFEDVLVDCNKMTEEYHDKRKRSMNIFI